MKLNLKFYKLLKTKIFIKNNSLILLFNSKDNISLNILKNFNSYSIRNKILKKILINSNLYNLINITNGTIIFVTFKNYDLKVKNFTNLKNKSLFIGLKLNNKLYSANQLNKIKTLNYYYNIKSLHTLLSSNFIFNSLKLKKIRNNVI